jgi:hypothetical protein
MLTNFHAIETVYLQQRFPSYPNLLMESKTFTEWSNHKFSFKTLDKCLNRP